MSSKWKTGTLVAALILFTMSTVYAGPKDKGDWDNDGHSRIRHVLLISIDGMHAVDFLNCKNGLSGVNGGAPYCPNLAELAETAVNYRYINFETVRFVSGPYGARVRRRPSLGRRFLRCRL
jgi:hypothetical protein